MWLAVFKISALIAVALPSPHNFLFATRAECESYIALPQTRAAADRAGSPLECRFFKVAGERRA